MDGRNGEKAVDSEMCILRAAEILESLPAHGRVARQIFRSVPLTCGAEF